MLLIFIATILAASAGAFAQTAIRGFHKQRVAAQVELERRALEIPDPARARVYMQHMAAEPHHAGSAASKAVAHYALGQFQQWGLDAQIEEFEALLPYPTARELEMKAPAKFRARLKEAVMAGDPDTSDLNQLPTYNAYSGSGDVTAPLVYVNYGIPEDYDTLAKLGVDVTGKIVIARYGRSWRGTKPKVAQEHGALGCILYSDPKDDGYAQGKVYPEGPYRPAEGVQRGSVMDMPLYVGDPLSPGWASVKGSRRLRRQEAPTLMKIPVLPISHNDALPFLSNLRGKPAPEAWQGALPITYQVGPGPAVVRLKVDSDWAIRPIHNVIARIPGKQLPDEWIIYGNHHDAWVNGANDPVSGAVALMETARTLAELARQGWRPRRTIVFALWDAEEFGLIGSTEWAEKHHRELRGKAVAYLNSDTNFGGRFSASGSPILQAHLNEILQVVRDPKQNKTLWSMAKGSERGNEGPGVTLAAPGAGSDYVAFLHHLGIPCLNLGFSSPGAGGTYHSIYDSYAWFTQNGDGEFVYAKALAQVQALSILRLSESDVIPFEFTGLSRAVDGYLNELEQLVGGRVAGIPLQAMRESNARLAAIALRYEARLAETLEGGQSASKAMRKALMDSERVLTSGEGLPGRPWYKHLFYAPGRYTGYSAKTLPAVREALEAGRWEEAAREANRIIASLEAMESHIRRLMDRMDSRR